MTQKGHLKPYPTLNQPIHWGDITACFSLASSIDEELVSNASIIAMVGDRYVIIQLDNGKWELPGGTLEAKETYLECVRREVAEEIGATLINYQVFGLFDCMSAAVQPYRPHIPHPRFLRVVGFGEVRIVGKPLNPADGEQVVNVGVVTIEEAVERFESIARYDIAELYTLAHQIRTS